ncbi:Ferredoxin subunit of nitrite reductase and ring-hydroxylating dioxygenase [Paraburkholderia piptadeniae]|uniref:Ferredoxin subunit of nitrite reductase and ring-hydroxylating dioxygenase n=2 Tax=Paraburkholderia piptadeniae TaxID=1701573 RepID=A0A1N7SWY5_9BURK|nr:Ferredoxin subunit of nitrite reductase and ring-hydroxylating dioxygenase [Paraburkholderia piptadeniae]
MMTATVLCPLDDIPDGGGKEIACSGADERAGKPAIVVLRRGDDVWAYRNMCPHFSIPLNYEADTFWTYEAEHLMCAHHSAMFRFEDGVCVDGPCLGAALTRVPVRIEARMVVEEDADDSDGV